MKKFKVKLELPAIMWFGKNYEVEAESQEEAVAKLNAMADEGETDDGDDFWENFVENSEQSEASYQALQKDLPDGWDLRWVGVDGKTVAFTRVILAPLDVPSRCPVCDAKFYFSQEE